MTVKEIFEEKRRKNIKLKVTFLLIAVVFFLEVVGFFQYLLIFCKTRVYRWRSKAFAGRWRHSPHCLELSQVLNPVSETTRNSAASDQGFHQVLPRGLQTLVRKAKGHKNARPHL